MYFYIDVIGLTDWMYKTCKQGKNACQFLKSYDHNFWEIERSFWKIKLKWTLLLKSLGYLCKRSNDNDLKIGFHKEMDKYSLPYGHCTPFIRVTNFHAMYLGRNLCFDIRKDGTATKSQTLFLESRYFIESMF